MSAPTKRLYLGRLNPDCQKEDLEDLFKPRPLVDIRIISHKGFGFVEFESSRDAEDVLDNFRGRDFMGEQLTIDYAKEQKRDRDERYGPPPREYRDRGDRYDRYDRGGRDYDRYDRYDRGDRYGDRYDRYRDDYGPPPREKRGPKPNQGYKVFVQGIDRDTSWQDLKDFGRDGGPVIRADVDRDVPGQGVIEYPSKFDADDAVVRLDNKELKGIPVQVVADTAEPSAGGGGYSGRGRSRSPPRRSSRYDDYDSRPPPPRRDDFDRGYDRYERERSPAPPAPADDDRY